MKRKNRIVAIILTLCLLVSSVTMSSTSVIALESVDSTATQETIVTEPADVFESSSQTIGSSKDIVEESKDTIEESEDNVEPTTETFKLPDIVSADEAVKHGYIGREKQAENDLSTFVFKNEDGTNTMRIYSHPVKYVTASGDIRDISLDIKKNTNGDFVTADHEIITTFAKNISNGITLEYDDVRVTMKPTASISKMSAATVSEDSKKVTYALDSKTSYEYALTYAGFKEDIVVNEYTGQTEYEFTLYTNGLMLYNEDGSYYLKDAKGNIVATIGDIIVFTADERNNCMGSMTHETILENQEYRMTIHLDSEYLQDEKTVYPIRIDPTIEINYTQNGAGAIEDTTINSLQGSSGSSSSLYIGKRATYGLSRVLMRFPNLNLSNISSASYITSASVELRDVLCEAESVKVYCYVFTGNDWTESTANWSNVSGNSFGATLSSQTVSYSNGVSKNPTHRYSFNILNAVKGWKTGTYSKNKGILFMASAVEGGSTNIHKTFASYNRATNQPSFTMEYTAAIAFTNNVKSVDEGSTKVLTVTTNPSNATVTWTSTKPSVATVSSSGVITGIKAGTTTIKASITVSGTTYSVSRTVYVTIPEGVYYIQNKNSSLYLTTNGNISDGTNVYQYSKYSEATTVTTRIRQMWRIQYIDNGKYSVRPLNILDMGLHATGTNVDIFGIGTLDNLTEIPNSAEWTISWYSSGYQFSGYTTVNGCVQVDGFSTSAGANVIFQTFDTSQNCLWNLIKILPVPTGVYFYNTDTESVETNFSTYIAPHEQKSFITMPIIAVPFGIAEVSQTVKWISNNTLLADVDQNSGMIMGYSPGVVEIKAQIQYGEATYFASYLLTVAEIANATYYLQNRQTGYYADIQGQTMASGTTVHQWESTDEKSQKWTFTHLGDGYYSIKSANSSTPYYLGVINNSTALNAYIVLRTGALTDSMMWKIEKTTDGAYKIIPKAGETNGYALATTTSDASNGDRLIQGAYVDNNSYRDEWIIKGQHFTVKNFYDYTFSESVQLLDNIPIAIQFANEVYQDLCKISFEGENPVVYENQDDITTNCRNGANLPCINAGENAGCGTNCEQQHHKSVVRISNDIYDVNMPKTERRVLWTNRPYNTYCEVEDNVHKTLLSVACVYDSRPVIHFLTVQGGSANEDKAIMAITLIHEMAHTFGMPDVYTDTSHDVSGGYVCAMEGYDPGTAWAYYNAIENGIKQPFCQSCKTQIIYEIMNDFIGE